MTTRPAPRDEETRQRMQRQKRLDTSAEVLLRRALHARGWRFRVGYPVPGLPRRSIDVAFPKQKVAVFIDGCFWHGCPEHYIPPKHNAAWWADKIAGNQNRDASTAEHLRAAGWTVIRLWEHQASEQMVGLVEDSLPEKARKQ